MNKISFDEKIEKQIHGYLYFPSNNEISSVINSFGCLKNNRLYEIYYIDKKQRFIFLGSSNSEDDAYEYLDEIFKYLHQLEIERILNAYCRLSKKNKKIYEEMIDFYLKKDLVFQSSFESKIKIYRK